MTADELYKKYLPSLSKVAGVAQKHLKLMCEFDGWHEINDKMTSGNWQLKRMDKNKVVAQWTLVQLTGCCGVCVSTAAWVSHNYREKGLGKILNNLRIDLAKIFGYSLLLCTDITSNKPQTKILKANSWKELYRFVNKNTSNTVALHVIDL